MKRLLLLFTCAGLLAGMVSCEKSCVCTGKVGLLNVGFDVGEMTGSECKSLTTVEYNGITIDLTEGGVKCQPE